ICCDYRGSFACEQFRGDTSHTTGCARHQNDLVFQSVAHGPLLNLLEFLTLLTLLCDRTMLCGAIYPQRATPAQDVLRARVAMLARKRAILIELVLASGSTLPLVDHVARQL